MLDRRLMTTSMPAICAILTAKKVDFHLRFLWGSDLFLVQRLLFLSLHTSMSTYKLTSFAAKLLFLSFHTSMSTLDIRIDRRFLLQRLLGLGFYTSMLTYKLMDWGNVTGEDLIEALREVDWSSPPRPVNEFFSRFTVPRSYAKWSSRIKCNLYYYRTNYFIMIVLILGIGFIRRPLAIVAAILTALTIAFLNDSFAGTFSEKVTRTIRRFSPHLAAKMRPPLTPVIRGRPSAKRTIFICGRPRWVFVFVFSSVSFILWFVSCGLLTVLYAFAVGLLATLLHASFRTPNLKARLNTFREEFRAVWRNYSEL